MDFNRRNFLKVATATLAAGGVGSAGAAPSGHALNAAPWLDAARSRGRRGALHVVSEFDALVEKTSSRRDRPYQFNRSDAYAEVMA